MLQKPAIFVGSSTEALSLAEVLQGELSHCADVRLWNEGVFEPSQTVIESLERNLRKFEIGVFIFSAEDKTAIRGRTSPAVRDNVIFELGLFMGMHGRNRTVVVHDATSKPHILSDLAGVTLASFTLGGKYPNLKKELEGPCRAISEKVKRLQPEIWRTKWTMPSGEVDETLLLFADANRITGRRELSGSQQQIFVVSGYRVLGCDSLTYSREDGSGSGTIVLQHLGAGRAAGVLAYVDAWETRRIQTLSNDWSKDLRTEV